jgi:hypothetical protein
MVGEPQTFAGWLPVSSQMAMDLHRGQAGQRRDFTRWSTAGLTP